MCILRKYVTFLSSRFRLLAAWHRWVGTMYICMYIFISISERLGCRCCCCLATICWLCVPSTGRYACYRGVEGRGKVGL